MAADASEPTGLDADAVPAGVATPARAVHAGATAAGRRTPEQWRRIRWYALGGYIALFIGFVALAGVPTGRTELLLWILLGLGIRCLGRGWRSFARVLADWLPFTAVLIAYDYTRGFATSLGIATHVVEPAHADEWMFGGIIPTVWLQDRLYVPSSPQWYEVIVTLVYTSHFLATPIAAVILWLRNRDRWIAFISRIIALSLAGLVTYVLYPAAPPWLAAKDGVIPPVARLSARGWQLLHSNHAGSLMSEAQVKVNTVAAMPSLHTATATLIAAFFFPRAPWWGKILLAGYPLLMGAVLVYSGEHYVVDLLFGYLYAAVVLAAFAVGRRLRDRLALASAQSPGRATRQPRAGSPG